MKIVMVDLGGRQAVVEMSLSSVFPALPGVYTQKHKQKLVDVHVLMFVAHQYICG